MDAKHRHELQENELADWLGLTIERVRPFMPVIVGAVALLVVGVVGWGAYRTSRTDATAEAWRLYSDAMVSGMPTPALLEQAANESSGTAVADWAALTLADSELWQASEAFFADRASAQKALDRAEPLYKSLVGARDPWISGRARFGLARLSEISGDLDEAIKRYGLVTGALAPLAKERVEALKDPVAVQTVAWLAESQAALPGVDAGEQTAGETGELSPDDVLMPPTESGPSSIDDMLKKYDESAGPSEDSELEKPEAEKGSAEAGATETDAATEKADQATEPESDAEAKPGDE